MRSVSWPRAVSMITGTSPLARMRRNTSRPSIRGSIRSSSTRSGVSVEPFERLLAVVGGVDLETLALEVAREHLAHHRFVVDHEDPHVLHQPACTTVLSRT